MECTTALNDELLDEFYSSIHSFLGSGNYSNTNPKIIKTYGDNFFAVRVNRGFERQLVLASAFSKPNDGTVGFYTIIISGTMKSISKKAYSLIGYENKG